MKSSRQLLNEISRKTVSAFMATAIVVTGISLPPVTAQPATVDKGNAPALPVAPVRMSSTSVTIVKPKMTLSTNPTDLDVTTMHLFDEPLIPMVGTPVANENRALAAAIQAYKAKNDIENIAALTKFIANYPKSRWVPSLQLNLGLQRFETGYLSEAMSFFQSAWNGAKAQKSDQQKQVADSAIGHLMLMEARLGRTDELEKHFDEIKGRKLLGSVETQVQGAKDGLYRMKRHPEIAYKCGPFALASILYSTKKAKGLIPVVEQAASTKNGTNLAQVKEWSDQLGMNYQLAKRTKGAAFITPAVMHWKVGHFAALLRQHKDKYQIQDPTFDVNGNLWITAKALEAETDGYFLIPSGPLPAGWTPLSKQQAVKVWGRGGATSHDENSKTPNAPSQNPAKSGNKTPKSKNGKAPGAGTRPGCGMAEASLFTMQVTPSIQDIPLSYQPPIGPSIDFLVNYNYLEADQPGTFTFPNLGADWSFNWVSYVQFDASQNATVFVRGGGSEKYAYSIPDNVNNPYQPNLISQAVLTKVGVDNYRRLLPDGSIEVFNQPDGTGKLFMTQVIDPQGNAASVQYDGNMRITGITDALGQTSVLTYVSNSVGNSGYYKIAQITDPFGRTCSFTYDSGNTYLTSTSDVIGLSSEFTYNTTNSLIQLMRTPYGTTTFYTYTPNGDPVLMPRGLRIILPDGSQCVAENWMDHTVTTYFWDREAMALSPDDPTNHTFSTSTRTAFLIDVPNHMEMPVISSITPPLASDTPASTDTDAKTTYLTTGQSGQSVGTSNLPIQISRSPYGGSTQTWTYEYNAFGATTKSIDPIGRTFTNKYAANNVDLLEVRETKGNDNFLLGKWVYNSSHLPTLYIDGSGQRTQYAYNSFGEMTTLTDATSSVTTLAYKAIYQTATIGGTKTTGDILTITVTDSGLPGGQQVINYTVQSGDTLTTIASGIATAINNNANLQAAHITATSASTVIALNSASQNTTTYSQSTSGGATETITLSNNPATYLASIQGPLSGNNDITKFGYDGYGRLYSVTDSEGYTLTFNYDNANRQTLTTFPDGSTEQFKYDKLDQILFKDRLGRWTQSAYDNMDQLVYQIDPMGRKTQYSWCTCGALASLTDPSGNVTQWARDREARVITKTFADSSTYTYTYDTNGRLKTRNDALTPTPQTTTYSYNLDDTLSGISYTNAVNATSPVSITYDANFPRVTSIAQSSGWGGTIGYTYNAYITDPFATPTTGGGQLASITNSVIGSGATTTYTYDALGRTTNRSINSSANSITWAYDAISRITSEVNTLGTFTYDYVDNTGGSSKGVFRLASITYPNTQATNFDWYPNVADQRLQRITNLGVTPAPPTLSQFANAYNPSGEITQWQQLQNSTNIHMTQGYDLASQLTSSPSDSGAIATAYVGGTATPGDILTITGLDPSLGGGQQAISYTVQGGDSLTNIATGLKNAINGNGNLTGIGVSATSSGAVITITSAATKATQFTQSLNTGATETIGFDSNTSNPSTMTAYSYAYDGGSPGAGNRTSATIGGSTVNYTYNNLNELTAVSSPSATLTYDKNGNLTNDGTNTYDWDAENRLIKITYPSSNNYTQFTYDGLGRCAKIVETVSGSVTSTKQFVWCGDQICEERDGSGSLTKQFFGIGQTTSGTTNKFLYAKDHLGSVREITNNAGTIQADYAYDPYGQVTKVAGSGTESDFQYAGYYLHSRSGLNLLPFRAYNANLGRFINRDPIGEVGGINLYRYVYNRPINLIDTNGLGPQNAMIFAAAGIQIGGALGASAGLVTSAGALSLPSGAIGAVIGGAIGAISGSLIPDPTGFGSSPVSTPTFCMSGSKPGSKPKDAPPGTKPIDKTGLGHEDIETIKEDVLSGSADWTGIAPNGDVITGDSQGNAVNHGHYGQFLPWFSK